MGDIASANWLAKKITNRTQRGIALETSGPRTGGCVASWLTAAADP